VFCFTFSAVVALAASLLLTTVPLMKAGSVIPWPFYPDFNRIGQVSLLVCSSWLRKDDEEHSSQALIPVAVFDRYTGTSDHGSYQFPQPHHCIRGIGGGVPLNNTTSTASARARSMIIATMISLVHCLQVFRDFLSETLIAQEVQAVLLLFIFIPPYQQQ
jgi:hypothetical protein